MHDELILHSLACQLARSCVTAVEAHECILERVVVLVLDGFNIHICGNRVVDVEQCNCVFRNAGTDIFADCTVYIDLTRYGDSSCCKS